jgi:hypothetical protein
MKPGWPSKVCFPPVQPDVATRLQHLTVGITTKVRSLNVSFTAHDKDLNLFLYTDLHRKLQCHHGLWSVDQ